MDTQRALRAHVQLSAWAMLPCLIQLCPAVKFIELLPLVTEADA